MVKPVKPVKHSIEYYDYDECRDYLQEKYGYDERDYAKKYKNNLDLPYQDFWHWVCDNYGPTNGGFFEFYGDTLDDKFTAMEPWQREIYKRYIDEFGDENGNVTFMVSW